MPVVVGLLIVGALAFSYWRFYTSGRYAAKRPPQDLSGFREGDQPPPGN